MTLATRLSLFFLAALAVVLIGLTSAIYWVARVHQIHELNERLWAGLDTLNAAVEFEPNGLDWEPDQRRMSFGDDPAGENVVWGVFDERGQQIDGPQAAANLLANRVQPSSADESGQQDIRWHDKAWRIEQRTLRTEAKLDHLPNNLPIVREEGSGKRYARLVLMAGVPIEPFLRPLKTLLSALLALSLVIWLSAALVGRWLCTKALVPVTHMAQTARRISADDLAQRLPISNTGDELEDLGHAFNDLLTRLQISFEQQQRFAAEASHQLRTPLTAILGQIDVALRRERQPEEYRRALESARLQASQLHHIIEMLLFLSREDSEVSPPALKQFELGRWLTDHLRGWEHHARHQDFQIEIDPLSEQWISAHDGLLGQAVDSVLENACKFSAPGSTILLQIGSNETEVWLSIKDHGYGILSEDLPRIFNPFFRSAEAQRRGIHGTGLGLSVVSRIMVALHGRVEVASQPGEETRFTLYLSRVPVAESVAAVY